MPLGKEVGLGPGHIVLDGDPMGTQRPQQPLPTFGLPIVAKRSPISAIAELLYQIGPYALHDFHKLYRFCTSLHDALTFKIWEHLLKGLRSYGGYNLTEPGSPKFIVSPSEKLCVRSSKLLEVQERARGPISPCQVWWGSDFTRCRGGQKR